MHYITRPIHIRTFFIQAIAFGRHGAHLKRRSNPGMAIAVQTRKTPSHPMCFSRNPVGAEAFSHRTDLRFGEPDIKIEGSDHKKSHLILHLIKNKGQTNTAMKTNYDCYIDN